MGAAGEIGSGGKGKTGMRILWLILVAGMVVAGAEPPSVEQLMKTLSNWGRWGAKDQKGAVNLITPEVRWRAAGLVKEGLAVSLSRDADTVRAVDNSRPFERKMISSGIDPEPMFAMDTYTIS